LRQRAMGFKGRAICTLLKLVPLGIYLRAACCKFELPVLGCNDPLCPVAIGQPATDNCMPTGNTAEVKARCEHTWTPWKNGLIERAGVDAVTATSTESSGYMLMKFVGVLEVIGYLLLWLSPQFGALWLTVFMGFGLHLHVTFLNDAGGKLALQFVLFVSSLLVLVVETVEHENAEAPLPEWMAKKKPKTE